MCGTQRVWVQPAHIVVREERLRALYGIADDVRLEDLDPQELDDMIGEAILSAPDWDVEFDEDWREGEPEPYRKSDRCRCGHWLRVESIYGGAGHLEPRSWVKGEVARSCTGRDCGCSTPERQPDPPWVRHSGAGAGDKSARVCPTTPDRDASVINHQGGGR